MINSLATSVTSLTPQLSAIVACFDFWWEICHPAFSYFCNTIPRRADTCCVPASVRCRLSHNDGIKGACGWRHAASKIVGCNQSIGIEESDVAHSKRVRRVHASGILSALFSALLPFALFASEAASAQEVKQIMFLPGAA